MDRVEVFHRLNKARIKADEKWGGDTGSNGPWIERPYTGVTILTEEVGEVARAVLDKDPKNLHDELIDVMQVCCAWLESINEEY